MIHVIIETEDGHYTAVTVDGTIQTGLGKDETLGNCASVLYRERPQYGDVNHQRTSMALTDANTLTEVANALTNAAAQVITARNARLTALIKES